MVDDGGWITWAAGAVSTLFSALLAILYARLVGDINTVRDDLSAKYIESKRDRDALWKSVHDDQQIARAFSERILAALVTKEDQKAMEERMQLMEDRIMRALDRHLGLK